MVNDALVALEAGAPGEPGVVVISGTGSISYGRNAQGEAARAGGWGYVLGDEGSGYWIGRAALRAVLRQADRRGPVDRAHGAAAEAFRRGAPAGSIHQVYNTDLKPTAIGCARAAASNRRSRTATPSRSAFCVRAADELETLRAVGGAPARPASGSHSPFILAGGIFRAVPWLQEELERRLPRRCTRQLGRACSTASLPLAPCALALQEARGGAIVPAYKVD